MALSEHHERPEHDFYPTPPHVVRMILPFLPVVGPVLDPFAGDGAIVRVVRDEWGIDTIGYDIDPARRIGAHVSEHRDSLSEKPWAEVPLIVTNSPYTADSGNARQCVERVIREIAPRRATAAMLLRLGFAAGKTRFDLHQDYPSDMYVLAARPSYTKDGKTDRYDYAWFVWGPDRGGRWRVLS